MKDASIPSFERGLVVVLGLVVLTLLAPLAGAVSVQEEQTPSDAEVGTQVSATVLLEDLYRNPNLESWTLEGETELDNVTWTVTFLDQGGNQLQLQSFDGKTFSQSGINLADDVAEVRVKVTGTVPQVENYQYRPHHDFRVMSLSQTREGGTSNAIGNWTVEHYTQQSLAARQAIDGAASEISDVRAAGGNTDQAQDTLQDAIAAYESGSFDLAINLAGKAEDQATAAGEGAERTQFVLWGGLAIVAAVVVGAGAYWYQNRETPYDRLG